MLDSKGQEFSVFKLLISAVIAIVILTILLQIIGVIRPPSVGDPQAAAEALIKKIDTVNYVEQISDNVTFSTGKSLAAAAIASVSGGLSENHICLSKGIFENSPVWANSTEKIIYYEGSSDQRARLAGICIPAGDDKSLQERALLSGKYWSGPCSTCDETEKCCYITLISPSA